MTEEKEKAALPVKLDAIDPEAGLTLSIKKPFAFFFAEEDAAIGVSDIAADVTLTKSGDEVFAAGAASGTVRLQCSRCLADFESEISATLEAPFFPKLADAAPAGRAGDDEDEETDDGEGDINTYEGETLDLYPVLRDQLYLALPLKPLCKEDCKGLCPKCGADLNVTTCGCKPESHDSRLAVLRTLKDKL